MIIVMKMMVFLFVMMNALRQIDKVELLLKHLFSSLTASVIAGRFLPVEYTIYKMLFTHENEPQKDHKVTKTSKANSCLVRGKGS